MSGEAPGGLELVQALINTVELPDGEDELGDPVRAAAWLSAHGVEVTGLSRAELARLIEVRETLRDALEAHTGSNVDEAVFVRLQGLLEAAPLLPRLSSRGGALVPARPQGVEGLIGAVAAAVVEATYRDTWERLKVCRSDSCRWAFYDRSKNGCGCWCSMETCGSREKARAYRARKRGVPA